MELTLNLPANISSLDNYIHSVNNIPLLTQEEETELATRLQESNDIEAARRMVMSHLRVVVSIARGYFGYGLPQADLIQEGNIGLMKAVRRFEPGRGVRLFSFAVHWIKAEINEYVLKNWRMVKVATTKAQRKLFFNLRSMRQHLATLNPAEAQAIAKELGVKAEEVREMETRMGGQDMPLLGLDNQDDENHWAPIDWLADDRDEPTQRMAQKARDWLHQEGIAQAMAQLDPRTRRIIETRWLSEGGEGLTLHDLAAEYGVSAERIRQIEQKGLQKLKLSLENYF